MAKFALEEQMIFRFIKGVTYPTDIFDSYLTPLQIMSHRQSLIAALPYENFDFVGSLQLPYPFPCQVVLAVLTGRTPSFLTQGAILHQVHCHSIPSFNRVIAVHRIMPN
ncbi:hypothetical protein PS2_000908 [Malus domestica]